jgi:glycosyltransferase involved in cell wall biosynthesis
MNTTRVRESALSVSVVICAKNAEPTLERCLESVEKNKPSEIILVDDGSTDNTTEIASRYTDKVYPNEGKGLSHARQLGAEKATFDHIFYVDSDVILSENCLQTMMHEMDTNGYTAIHAQVIGMDNASYWGWAEDRHFRMRFNREGDARSIITMAGIYKKAVILDYRFDPFFIVASEDGDLCYRLIKKGLKLGISSAFVYHQHRATFRSFIRQRVRYGRGNARFFWKHRAVMTLVGTSLMAPFGIVVCIERRSPKMFPYYLVWSLAGTYGTLSEMASLTFRRLMPQVPK